jgi:hypothetical protein
MNPDSRKKSPLDKLLGQESAAPVDALSLRDYFAAAALTGMIEHFIPSAAASAENVARFSYEFADAMLNRRIEK